MMMMMIIIISTILIIINNYLILISTQNLIAPSIKSQGLFVGFFSTSLNLLITITIQLSYTVRIPIF